MIADFERKQFLSYVTNAIAVAERRVAVARKIIGWYYDHADALGIDLQDDGLEQLAALVATKKWRQLWSEVKLQVRKAERMVKSAPPTMLATNIAILARSFDLDLMEEQILAFGVNAAKNPQIGNLAQCLDIGGGYGAAYAISVLIGGDANAVSLRLAHDAPLMASGLVRSDSNEDFRIQAWNYLSSRLADVNEQDPAKLLAVLVGTPAEAELEWDDFGHLAEHRQLMADILKGAIREKSVGVNILVYGPPGTGKTEFCKALAVHIGAKLFQVGEADDDGNEPVRRERISMLKVAQKILQARPGSILLFDEMEDLLVPRRDMASKVFANRLMELNPVPALWTCNDISGFDPALLRRMTLAVEMRNPPLKAREQVWRRNLDRWHVTLPDSDIRALSRDLNAAPALAANAAKAARLADGGVAEMRIAVASIAKAMRGGIDERPQVECANGFDPSLINSEIDLTRLADRLSRTEGSRQFSMCLYGPPGTGKSAFARHLAERMGLEVIQKRASDLLGMFVGESEKEIAAAFAEARDQQAFLIFDEVDSLLSDRTRAHQSWEVSQVNEMLTWMENHPLPFACTTNLMERLDSASLRRFTVKAKLDYLTPAQAQAAFIRFFGMQAPSDFRDMLALTPGDFAVVRRKAEVFDVLQNPPSLVTMLRDECAAKPNAPRPIGFR